MSQIPTLGAIRRIGQMSLMVACQPNQKTQTVMWKGMLLQGRIPLMVTGACETPTMRSVSEVITLWEKKLREINPLILEPTKASEVLRYLERNQIQNLFLSTALQTR
jgi:hypothetical protein